MAYTTINKSSEHFNTKLYNGTGANQSITGVGFQPDFTWIKIRTTGFNHRLQDSVRGATKSLYTNLTNAEQTNTDGVLSFDTDGFSLGDDASNGSFNRSGDTFVSWNWLGGGTASSNTDGSITSTVSANTTSGFSIVTWNNSSNSGTIGHGLGAKPSVIITKQRAGTGGWVSWFQGLGTSNEQRNYIYLDSTNASGVSSIDYWGTSINSNTFGVPSGGYDNNNGSMLAYCFAEKKGFSKFGSYVGNNNADGNFVYLGFKPAFVIAKNSTQGGYSWELFDNKRNTTDGVGNVIQKRLFPDSSAAEGGTSSTDYIDFLSNGFKIRKAGDTNASGDTYIYMAFAEEPLVGDNPCTAR